MSTRRQSPGFPHGKIEEIIERTIGEIRSSGDTGFLNECRALFRKKTPLSLRAYVAAALLLKAGGSPRPDPRRERKDKRDRRDERPAEDHREPRRDERKPAPQRNKPAEIGREEDALPKTEARFREGHYAGEGATLFVSAGRRQHVYARHIFRLLSDVPVADENTIGAVRVLDNYSFVVVDPSIEDAVTTALNGKNLRGRVLVVNRARKRASEESVSDDVSGNRVEDDADCDIAAAPGDDDGPGDEGTSSWDDRDGDADEPVT
ncbi:MAG: DbpA RNA binding domain-containing protein [Spirochaetes bacterium]|nr:DbpA RNA binding domain-containing protein [Spirochaetota bacterium]